MKKILIVATVQSHIAQFHQDIIYMMKKEGYQVHIAAKDNLSLKNGLQLRNVDKKYDIPFSRSPLNKSNFTSYKLLKQVIDENNYDIIQCNTPVGGIVTRLAAKKNRKLGTKVIYMAHGFHFYKGAPKKNWLLYYPLEKFFARYTDTLITINLEDYHFAKKKFKCNVEHIYGIGVSNDKFYVHTEQEKKELRKKYHFSDDDFLIICIGELNKNKNQITLIKAINEIKESCPKVKVLFAGNGPLEMELKKEVDQLSLNNHIVFLGYTRELVNIIPFCDCLVSCSYREGLPLNIIEGLLSGIPVVVSKNRGHNELVKDGKNGFRFDVQDYISCGEIIKKIYKYKDLLKKLSTFAVDSVDKYKTNNVINKIKKIYLN